MALSLLHPWQAESWTRGARGCGGAGYAGWTHLLDSVFTSGCPSLGRSTFMRNGSHRMDFFHTGLGASQQAASLPRWRGQRGPIPLSAPHAPLPPPPAQGLENLPRQVGVGESWPARLGGERLFWERVGKQCFVLFASRDYQRWKSPALLSWTPIRDGQGRRWTVRMPDSQRPRGSAA